ncbi:MAG: hypothetical protein Kow0056_15660 [Coriobacteriia bacterium]
MPSIVKGVALGPDILYRERLVRLLCRCSDRVSIVCAPSGYGKTTLLAQVCASSSPGSEILYVDCEGLGSDEVLRALAFSVGRSDADSGEFSPLSPSVVPTGEDVVHEICVSLSEAAATVILDNLDFGVHGVVFDTIVGKLSEAPRDWRIIGSSSSMPPRESIHRWNPWVIDEAALRLTPDEAIDLAERMCSGGVTDAEVSELVDLCGGQVSLFRVLLRNTVASGSTDLDSSVDLQSTLVTLAEKQLSEHERAALLAMSLLEEGRVSDLLLMNQGWSPEDLEHVALCIPLVRLYQSDESQHFSVHGSVSQAFVTDFPLLGLDESRVKAVVTACLKRLEDDGRIRRLLKVCEAMDDLSGIEECIVLHGEQLVAGGDLSTVKRALSLVNPHVAVSNPWIMYVAALLARHEQRCEESLRLCSLIREMAEHAGDLSMYSRALLLQARVEMDQGMFESALEHLTLAKERMSDSLSASDCAYVSASLTICMSYLARVDGALEARAESLEAAADQRLPDAARAYAAYAAVSVHSLLTGRFDIGAFELASLLETHELPLYNELCALNNLSCSVYSIGRLDQAERYLSKFVEGVRRHRIPDLESFVQSGLALKEAVLHNYSAAEDLMAVESGSGADLPGRIDDYLWMARWRRAAGDACGSLAAAEQALAVAGREGGLILPILTARVEKAASHLALGDTVKANAIVRRVSEEAAALSAAFEFLTSDSIASLIDLRQGNRPRAVARLIEHADYIQTESANLMMAFYIRAFPELLGLLADAVGPDRLPVHMLNLIGEEESRRALVAAWGDMEEGPWHILAERLLEADEAEKLARTLDEGPPCRVRLFGGLEVSTPDGEVPDRAWRKRKARLLFAMLVAKRGQDVPRDRILEHLWPDLDEAKARNNFYVAWNTMKSALSPNVPKGEPCPYVESVGGICRAVRGLVRSDLDDFEDLITRARIAQKDGSIEVALDACRRITDIYRGDLLPGDLYDDWFGSLRERCRQQFGDAMMAAAGMLAEDGRLEEAIQFLRRAMEADPLREDVYQQMLRLQIEMGMRSAAVETFMACKERLAEDLGLDPSSETFELYERVLAMEEPSANQPGTA